jgi:hypothetical protein
MICCIVARLAKENQKAISRTVGASTLPEASLSTLNPPSVFLLGRCVTATCRREACPLEDMGRMVSSGRTELENAQIRAGTMVQRTTRLRGRGCNQNDEQKTDCQ